MCKCNNPHGRKLATDTTMQPSRKRPTQQWQMPVPKSVKFAIDAGEQITSESCLTLESLVLESIFKHCTMNRIPSNIEQNYC